MHFLNEAAKLYELNVFTKGSRSYARDIVAILDPEQKLFGLNYDRIISADEKKGFAKDLQEQYPCPDTMVVIVDDRDDVWEETNPHNVVKVTPYRFWSDALAVDEMYKMKYDSKQHRLAVIAETDCVDTQLQTVLGVLRELHRDFYQLQDATKAPSQWPSSKLSIQIPKAADVKEQLLQRRKAVLEGVHIVFSRCFDLRERASEQDVWILAEAFGAKCYEDLGPAVTHCVTKKCGTAKVNNAYRQRKHVVHIDWLKQSIKGWHRLPEAQFKVSDVLQRERHHTDFSRNAWFAGHKKPRRRAEIRKDRTRVTAHGAVESDSDSGSDDDRTGSDSDGYSSGEGDVTSSPTLREEQEADSENIAEELEDFLASSGSDDGDDDDDDDDEDDEDDEDEEADDDVDSNGAGAGIARLAGAADSDSDDVPMGIASGDSEDEDESQSKRRRLDSLGQ